LSNHGSNHSNLSRTLALLIDNLSLVMVELYMFCKQIIDFLLFKADRRTLMRILQIHKIRICVNEYTLNSRFMVHN
jgi:hypothetical protein